jgi:DNA repair protein RadB
MITSGNRVKTGIKPLDELLGGGFQPGAINLIYGEAASGKTTLVLLTAVNFLKKSKATKCIYIDSDSKINIDRLEEIAAHKKLSVLNQFNLFIPYTFKEQEEVIEHLQRLSPSILVILDSVTSLYRAEITGEEETYRLNKELNRQLGYMAELARTSGSCFILTGQVRSVLDSNQIEPVASRLLGYWSSSIIKLEKNPSPGMRQVILEKPRRPGNVIIVKVTNEGMSEVLK